MIVLFTLTWKKLIWVTFEQKKQQQHTFGPLLPAVSMQPTLFAPHTLWVCGWPVFLAGAELSHEVAVLAGDGGALDVGVCVIQERFTVDLRLLLPQLAGGWVQLLLCSLNDNSHVITQKHLSTEVKLQIYVNQRRCVCCVCLLTPACFTSMWTSREANSKFSL